MLDIVLPVIGFVGFLLSFTHAIRGSKAEDIKQIANEWMCAIHYLLVVILLFLIDVLA